ncbi:MAG: Holliday junction DNA helicase RuvA [Candidatus Staskawiczbacteria bacterium RIFOXYC1_FULL_37_43]|nr:MAG: Holliday junction DNA helicase RuvA [Candidatus Staskawiczbacteria bacterium RIFCSPHIGHO2_01_FULL_37_17]OGZ71685.1 MAG: Holliday junction DNA helicase RuvA [Candidatus Staskawiczbacteria bacterium RIFCSPLOWO2_01_FULL_37_19]OGZ75379.1 MAG: Holliday junction DNA helicase RuvA [Candidatus Staskawiczbacteria bacterium RIFOXYA1_FULL_37_15]OGZ76913.1 MAG: Holliday junction DNA helicase RuvA [Candidatus Staskawiczbacteria bacterium RIFOXYA12_FULL_37_10]OGZ80829.1 MAG: Holliday junction DNA hel
MISFLEGKVILKKDKFVIIEVAGIGYKVFLSRQTLLKLPASAEASAGKPQIAPVKFFIYHDIREDKSDLYGFLTYEELEFFEILNDIRGIGPKAALEISVVGPLEKIKDKILKQDENVFAGIPGIGSKRAMTIILELTGKIKQLGQKSSSADEAENALVQLGFSKQQAKEALSHIASNIKNTEERIKLALKNLGK